MTTFCLPVWGKYMCLITAIGELLACNKSPNAVGWKNTSLAFQQGTNSRKERQQDRPVSISLHH